jgi:DNA helicase-2/ATP-dependent DNA helicase PcrA
VITLSARAANEAQLAAATSVEPNLLVVAPPGCGKTDLLAMRAAELIGPLSPHQKVLALTFTNRAKANLGDRLCEMLGPQRFRRYVTLHNFHGHAADVIQSHGRTLGMIPDKLLFPTTRTLKKALRGLSRDPDRIEAAEMLLGRVKREPRTDEQVARDLAAAGDTLAARVEADRVAAGQLHYDDLLRLAQLLLHIEKVARLYQRHYGAVLVDEFQDLSRQQLDIVLRTSTCRTFAGDPLQGIFSWAGAEPKAIEVRLRELCGDPVELKVCYRSSPGVLWMVNALAVPMGAVALTSHDPGLWRDGGASAVVAFGTRQHEAAALVDITGRITAGDPEASIGIIARSKRRRVAIDAAFSAAPHIPCRNWDMAIDDPPTRDRIRASVARLPRGATVEQARAAAASAVDANDIDTLEELHNAFDQLTAVAGPEASVRSVLARYRRIDNELVAVGPGVHLLNAHTGKGQQFDWVFLVGMEEGQMPIHFATSPAEVAEERRVLLVMLSRARHGVVVTRCKVVEGRWGPFEVAPSPWLATLSSGATLGAAQLLEHVETLYPAPAD